MTTPARSRAPLTSRPTSRPRSLDRPVSPTVGGTVTPPLRPAGSGAARSLPIRIMRHARSLTHQTVLSAEVARRSVDLLQETTLTVRHGTLTSLEIRVPAAIADRWDLLDREVVAREELDRRPMARDTTVLSFARPVLDKAVLRFRCHLPIAPHLDATGTREVAMPWISFPEAAGPVRLELSMAPGILFQGNDPAWISVADDGQANRGNPSSTLAFTARPGRAGPPVCLQGPGTGSGRNAVPCRSPPADSHGARLRRNDPQSSPVLGRDSRAGRLLRDARRSPLARRPGRWPGHRPGGLRCDATRLSVAAPRRGGLSPHAGRAGVPARWPGRRIAMACPAATRRWGRARDALGCAAPLGSGDRRGPAGLVR